MLALLALAQLSASGVAVYENTQEEQRYCDEDPNGQGLRFCLADKKHQRAELTLAAAMNHARHGALVQASRIAEFKKRYGGVTLAGDPVRVLTSSQTAWEKSFKADCWAAGLAVATGGNGTEGVIENWNCEAGRMLDRAQFLDQMYSTEG